MPRTRDKGLWLIAALKLVKGLTLLAVAVGALHYLHRDMDKTVSHWIDILRVDPDNKYLHHLIQKLMAVDERQLRAISAGSFFYSALMLTEGVGLMLEKHWAEYLTIVATSSFLPLEVYEIFHHYHWGKVALLITNLAIVVYLIWVVRRNRQQRMVG